MSTAPFKTVLRDWRRMIKLPQSDAAELLDVPLRTYQEWEQGRSEPHMMLTRDAVCNKMKLCLDIQAKILAFVRREQKWKKVI